MAYDYRAGLRPGHLIHTVNWVAHEPLIVGEKSFPKYYSYAPGYHFLVVSLEERMSLIEFHEQLDKLSSLKDNEWQLAVTIRYKEFLKHLQNTCRHLIYTNTSEPNYTRKQLIRKQSRVATGLMDYRVDLLTSIIPQNSWSIFLS